MNRRIANCFYATAGMVVLIGLVDGCGEKAAQNGTSPAATVNLAAVNPSDVPVVVNGPEMTQSVPPPPQVAASPNTIEIVHKLPPVPAHVTTRHKRLHLVKYEDKYWLQDVDHHCYIAARDNGGHYYPACYDSSGQGSVYPLYYDSARDDYYRACSDPDHHYYRCYEDEPDYVYYYDPDPIYDRHGGGWNAEYEPEIDAPAYSASWGVSIPLFSAALYMFPPWHSHWWLDGGWSAGGDSFVDISFGRPYFDYYSVPSEYPFVYANTLFALNIGWRTDPGWYQHGRFDQTAYQSGTYRSFSGFGRRAAAGTMAAAYEGPRAFHGVNSAAGAASSSRMAVGAAHTGSGSFGRGGGAAVARTGAANQTAAAGRSAAAIHGAGASRTASAGHSQGSAAIRTRPTAHAGSARASTRLAHSASTNGGAHARSEQATHVAPRSSGRNAASSNHTAARAQSSGRSSGSGQTHSRQTSHVAARSSGRSASSSNHTAARAQTSGRSSGNGQTQSRQTSHVAARSIGRSSGGGGARQRSGGGGAPRGGGGQRSGGGGAPRGGGGQRSGGGGAPRGGGGGQHGGGGGGKDKR